MLKIRNGEFEFDELMRMVGEKMELIKLAYEKSTLPDKPNIQMAEGILIQIRDSFY